MYLTELTMYTQVNPKSRCRRLSDITDMAGQGLHLPVFFISYRSALRNERKT